MNVAYNMDCMEAMKEFPDKFFDLAVVDPVYGGVNKGGYMRDSTRGKVVGTGAAKQKEYNCDIWKQDKSNEAYFNELFRVSKNQVIWGGNYFQKVINQDSQCWLVWDKQNDNSKFADCELAWTSYDKATRIFRFMWNGMLQGNMKHKETRIHPTQKPVELYAWVYNMFVKPGYKILDTHLGSGSSRIAAYNMGIDFYGYEINKTYFDLQEQRFQNHIAQQNLFLMS